MIKKIIKHPGIVFLSLVVAAFPVMISARLISMQNQYACSETLKLIKSEGLISQPRKIELQDEICNEKMDSDQLTHRAPIWLFWSAIFTFIGIAYREREN